MHFKIVVILLAWSGYIYIGGYEKSPESQWTWSGILTNEMPLNGDSQSDWHGSEPAANSEKCAVLVLSQGWHNVGCSDQWFFLCEK